MRGQRLRDDLMSMFRAALAAVDPYACVRACLARSGRYLTFGTRTFALAKGSHIWVAGMGKAAAGMASAVEEVATGLLAGGVVVTTEGSPTTNIDALKVIRAAHPVPDARCAEGGRELIEVARHASAGDLLIVLISGGGSSLSTLPSGQLLLEDLVETNRLLLLSGASIAEMNCVRKHLSAVAGGQLSRHAAPAQVVALVLSDVVGDPLDVIASGPTVADPSTYTEARSVLERFSLWERVPGRVRRHISQGQAGLLAETPKPGDPDIERAHTVVVGSGATAASAAAREAEIRGYRSLVLSTTVQGEARHVGTLLAAIGRELVHHGRPVPPPAAIVLAGETTVTVNGDGRGGRCQEVALAAALGMAGLPGAAVAALGTDGIDGPTDAAGAIVDGSSTQRLFDCGHDPRRALDRNDVYPALEGAGDLVLTGPTGTNVADLYMLLVDAEPQRARRAVPSPSSAG